MQDYQDYGVKTIDNNTQDVSIEEIMRKIKDEVAKLKSIDADINNKLNKNIEINKINFPQQRIDLFINDIRVKSQIRTKIPDALNRFPVNKSKLLQKIILKFYELLFREQRAVNNKMLDILQELSAVQSKTTEEIDILQTKFSELDGGVNRTNQDIFRQIKDHKLNIIDIQRRLMLFLEETDKRLPEPISAQHIDNILKEEDHIFDAMYVTFEDKFRGTRQDIKNRQKVYLSYIQEASDKTAGAPIIDVGCGRGEWIELLKESDFDVKGIDLNKVMINTCRELNLDVVESDALDYLRSLPADSLCAVTGFHIIEHLPFKTLIALFDESFRALKPGGIVIFETPNPENLIVGGCNFYIDPSHIKPLVPVTMQFIAEQRGFSKVEIKRLHKYSDYYNVSEENKFISENFYNEMDYSVIGVKSYMNAEVNNLSSSAQKVYLELRNKINFTKKNEISSIPYIINFQDKDNNSIDFIDSGFCYPESWGTWSCAKDARLFFDLEEHIIIIQPLYLKINFRAFTKNNHNQLFEFYLNNELLAKKTYKNDDDIALILNIQKLVQKQNWFAIKIPNAISPKALGINEDNRELGIGLINIQLLTDS